MSTFLLIFLIVVFLLRGNFGLAILTGIVLYLVPLPAEAASITSNDDWKAFYAIMICCIWALLYWLLRPIAEIVISWCLPKGATYANVQEWMGCYLILILMGCLLNVSMLGG